eukprot:TRINITY_DN27115_c0_g1_i1.p1 TRINITY_DN27115_c0_g1~~TRINITY_DN27115_c0_g1_i1.p1  ORF type:complete len:500 (-),score=69.04 TRINITY_DN27115_c0_g1_i1:133-1632(-)
MAGCPRQGVGSHDRTPRSSSWSSGDDELVGEGLGGQQRASYAKRGRCEQEAREHKRHRTCCGPSPRGKAEEEEECRRHHAAVRAAYHEALQTWKRSVTGREVPCAAFLRHARSLATRACRNAARFRERRCTELERGHANRYADWPLTVFVPSDGQLLRFAYAAAGKLRSALTPLEWKGLVSALRSNGSFASSSQLGESDDSTGDLRLVAVKLGLPFSVYVSDTIYMLRLFRRMRGLAALRAPSPGSVLRHLGIYAGVAFSLSEAARALTAALSEERLWEVLSLESQRFLEANRMWARGVWLPSGCLPRPHYNFTSWSMWMRGAVDVLEVHQGEIHFTKEDTVGAATAVPCLLLAPACCLQRAGALPVRLFAEASLGACSAACGAASTEKEVLLPPFTELSWSGRVMPLRELDCLRAAGEMRQHSAGNDAAATTDTNAETTRLCRDLAYAVGSLHGFVENLELEAAVRGPGSDFAADAKTWRRYLDELQVVCVVGAAGSW